MKQATIEFKLGGGNMKYGWVWLVCTAVAGAQEGNWKALEGTKPLTMKGDLAEQLVAGVDKFLLDQTEQALKQRGESWQRNLESSEAYERSVSDKRIRLRRILGAVDRRVPVESLTLIATTDGGPLVGKGNCYEVLAVRWPVLPGVNAEGLLLRPTDKPPIANVIALPDADWSPEAAAGLVPGVPLESQFVRRLAESGCRVLVPLLIDRKDTYSGVRNGRSTNQPHREFVYRGAFEMGRHVIGYEVQKVLAAVDWFEHESASVAKPIPLGVMGYGEGGLLAFYAAAIDPRIQTVCVSGYFNNRQQLWEEPIYRNVWALLTEFGDAEIASLIAPSSLLVEASAFPSVTGPPPEHDGRRGAAPGFLKTPELSVVQTEFDRARAFTAELKPPPLLELIPSGNGSGPPGSEKALQAFLKSLHPEAALAMSGKPPQAVGLQEADLPVRMKQQLDQLNEFTQKLMLDSEYTRNGYWGHVDTTSLDNWRRSVQPYREYLATEVIGRFDLPLLPANPRTRQVYDEPGYTGYEVVLDVWPDVFAYGILLLPKGIKPGERRPVVVCQHGLEGRPQDVADPKINKSAYKQFACMLADRGFITFSPQNLYIFGDKFRTLQRKANPLKKSLFSVIVPQHDVITTWLASLPMVDGERIGFYGLSYGGKTAMRVPPLVPRYCLSICSGDFNEWIWKNVSNRHFYSYLGTPEYEMFEFDLGNTYNYSDMAGLIAPRPFMVERGHHDRVAPDEWVAYEYSKVRRRYVALGIADRTEIEFFDGPHAINGVGSYKFLHKHLNWPEPAEKAGGQ